MAFAPGNMTEVHQPQTFDAVLGGQSIAPAGSVVLGGLEGLRRRLRQGKVEERIAALWDCQNYGQKGLDLLIRALSDRSRKVQRVAYKILRDRSEVQAQIALEAVCTFPLFEPITALEGHDAGITAIAIGARQFRYRADQQIVVSASRDGIVQVWDVEQKEPFLTLDAESFVYAIAIDNETDSFTILGENQHRQAWSFRNGQPIAPSLEKLRTIASVTVVGDRQYMLSGSGNSIKIWELATGKELASLYGHTRPVTAIALSDDHQHLVSGSEDRTVRLWGI